jgi:hypothetical protein
MTPCSCCPCASRLHTFRSLPLPPVLPPWLTLPWCLTAAAAATIHIFTTMLCRCSTAPRSQLQFGAWASKFSSCRSCRPSLIVFVTLAQVRGQTAGAVALARCCLPVVACAGVDAGCTARAAAVRHTPSTLHVCDLLSRYASAKAPLRLPMVDVKLKCNGCKGQLQSTA